MGITKKLKCGFKLFYLVEKKNKKIENVFYINLLSYTYYIYKKLVYTQKKKAFT